MKAQFLKAAGVSTPEEFLEKYPTEESFFVDHPNMNQHIKDKNIKSSVRAKRWDKFLETPGVSDKIKSLAKKFKWSPNDVMSVIETETGGTFDPKIVSKAGYSGLFQFGEVAAKDAGTTRAAIRKMNAVQQLEAAEKYFSKWGGSGHPYDLVSLPKHRKEPDTKVLYGKDSAVAKKNPKWVGADGTVTKTSIRSAAEPFHDYSFDVAPAPAVEMPAFTPQEVVNRATTPEFEAAGVKKYAKGTQSIEIDEQDNQPASPPPSPTPSTREKKWVMFLSQPGVKSAVMNLAKKHNWSPERLMSIFETETAGSFSPSQPNLAGSSATGLIQLMDKTLKELGYTTKQITSMSAAEQINGPIVKFFDKYGKGAKDPYVVVAASGHGRSPGHTEIYTPGSASYNANKLWRDPKTQKITPDSISNSIDTLPGFKVASAKLAPINTSKNLFPALDRKGRIILDLDANGRPVVDTTKTKVVRSVNPNEFAPVTSKVYKKPAIPIKSKEQKEWYKTPSSDTANKLDQKDKLMPKTPEQIRAENEAARKRVMWNTIDKEGLEAEKNISKAATKYSTVGGYTITPLEWAQKYVPVGARIENALGSREKNLMQVGFKSEKSRQKMEDFLSYLKHDANVSSGVMDGLRFVDAYQSKLLTGQSIESSMIAAIGDILSGEKQEDIKKWVEGAKKKGIIGNTEAYIVKDIVENPENYVTNQAYGNLGVNVALLLKNPKAIVDAGKMVIKAGGKVLSVPKALAGMKDVKGGKALAMKLTQKVLNAVKDNSYVYSKGDTGDKLAAVGKELDNLGITKQTKGTWKETFGYMGELAEKAPKTMRKTIFNSTPGSGIEEVANNIQELETALGKPIKEIVKLSKNDLALTINSKVEPLNKSINGIVKDIDVAVDNYNEAKNTWKAARAELSAAKNSGMDVTKATEALTKAEANVGKTEKLLSGALAKQGDYNKMSQQVRAFEKYGSKTASVTPEEINVYKKLNSISDAPEGVSKARKVFQDSMKTRSSKIAQLDNLAAASSEEKAAQAATNLSKSVVNTLTGKKAEILAELEKLNNLPENLGKYKDLIKELKTSAKTNRAFARAALTVASWPLDKAQGMEEKIKELEAEPDTIDITEDDTLTEDDSLDTGGFGESEEMGGDNTIEDMGTDNEPAEVKSKAVNPTQLVTEESVVAPDLTPKEPKADILGTLASYAPAIYNITKGLQPADKVERRTIAPKGKTYKNMSQEQLNMIDDAFNVAIGNARNLSGGSISNFRANTEGSWAERMRRVGAVNQYETGRADQVANDNISISNDADKYNSQINAQADIQDMQSKAVTKSFLAQGVQDLANISYRNKTDLAKEKSQKVALNMISSGRYKIDENGNMSLNDEYLKSPSARGRLLGNTKLVGVSALKPTGLTEKTVPLAKPLQVGAPKIGSTKPWSFVDWESED